MDSDPHLDSETSDLYPKMDQHKSLTWATLYPSIELHRNPLTTCWDALQVVTHSTC